MYVRSDTARLGAQHGASTAYDGLNGWFRSILIVALRLQSLSSCCSSSVKETMKFENHNLAQKAPYNFDITLQNKTL